MPQFLAGEIKTAGALMKNPTLKTFNYRGEIYMGTDLVKMSDVSFSLNAGEEKQVAFPVTMPALAGTYPVHIGIFSEGKNIALYKAEDVVITSLKPSLRIVPDASGLGQIYTSGCSIDKMEYLNPDTGIYEELSFASAIGRYDPEPAVNQGQNVRLRITSSAWLYPSEGYWPSYARAWEFILVIAPDGTEVLRQNTPIHNVFGRGESNKTVTTVSWEWVCVQSGIYLVTTGVRNVMQGPWT